MKHFAKIFYSSPWENILQFITPFVIGICLTAGRYVFIAGLFVLADLATGIIAARKRGDKITSTRMRDSVGKFIAYGSFVLVAAIIELAFLPDFPCTKLVTMFVVYIELKSIDENAKTITGHSIFSRIIRMINPKRKS